MEPFSKEVFDLFQQKLKVGNRRGVHLNAIANNSRYKFDLSRLSAIFKSLPERFLSPSMILLPPIWIIVPIILNLRGKNS